MSSSNDFAQTYGARPDRTLELRQGVVVSITGGSPASVQVDIGGPGNTYDCGYLAGTTLTGGDVVFVLDYGPAFKLVLGKQA